MCGRRVHAWAIVLENNQMPPYAKGKSMRFTPEVLSILWLRTVPLTLFTMLAFVVVSTVFSVPLTAQTQRNLPTTVPSLSRYDSETRQSMELACVSQNVKGPVAYGACLNQQIASLQSSPGIPSLSGYDSETRQSMELACVSQNVKGPVAYGACLNQQIASLQSSPGIPSLSGYDSETRQSMELACVSQNVKGPVAYGACLNQQIASLQSSPGISPKQQTALRTSSSAGKNSDKSKRRGSAIHPVNATGGFTTENIMKIHRGMNSDKILEMFGAPKDVSQSVCGAAVGAPWTCTSWKYGEAPYEWASFTFSDGSGSLILNDYQVHRK